MIKSSLSLSQTHFLRLFSTLFVKFYVQISKENERISSISAFCFTIFLFFIICFILVNCQYFVLYIKRMYSHFASICFVFFSFICLKCVFFSSSSFVISQPIRSSCSTVYKTNNCALSDEEFQFEICDNNSKCPGKKEKQLKTINNGDINK